MRTPCFFFQSVQLTAFRKFFILSLAFLTAYSASTNGSESLDTTRPNIILINLDDADYRMFQPELLELYPHIKKLAAKSISFTNLHATTPFCGPSRASLFRGQYAHRTGVRVNIPESHLSLGFKGGYKEFLRQGHDKDELGVWMKRAGYRTMMIGKYHHNGFDFRKPPGWDDFYMSNGGRYQGTYRFTTKDDPKGSNSQNGDDVYRTDQEIEDAVRLIRDHHNGSREINSEKKSSRRTTPQNSQPFFLYLAPLAPHRPVGRDFTNMVDKKKYDHWQPDLRIPPTPEFDESQMSDKPLHRQSPPYTTKEIEVLESEYLSRARAVKSVDDMVGKLQSVIEECDLSESTYVFFTSDNGYQLGQHRLHNKLDPYQMCTNVPLFVSGPEIKPNQTANHLLAHLDLCPTILELAGADIPATVDGKSFVPLLIEPKSHDEKTWRKPIIIENWQAKRNRGKVLPGTYSGLRFYDQVYVEWVTGDKEFYDLASDPFELDNGYSELSDLQKSKLKKTLRESRAVEMMPIVTVIPMPVETTQVEEPAFIRGYAEDDKVIERVSLVIQDMQSKKFWNGTQWSQKRITVTADLSATDQQIVSWNYPRSGDLKDNGLQLNVTAIAYDASENASKPISQTVESEPVSNQPATKSSTIK